MTGDRTAPRVAVVLGAMAAILIWPSAATAAAFQTPIDIHTGYRPGSLIAADFNGNGRADLAVINRGDPSLSIILDPGPETAATTYYAPTAADAMIDIAAMDVDRDGSVDLVFTTADHLTVWHGNGDGTFAPTDALSVQGASDLAVLDSDAGAALAVGRQDGTVSVFESDGNGGLQIQGSVDVGGFPEVRGADLDADGTDELVIIRQDGAVGRLIVAELRSGGWRVIQRLDLAGIPIGMTAATQAGRVTDLAVIESGPNRLDQFSVGRSGRLRKAGSVDLPSLPHGVATADFDGDGRTSVLVSYPGVAPLTYLDNVHQFDLGRRGPALTSDLSSGASCGGDLAVADLDGDGTSDLAVADACSFDVWVLISI